MQEHGLHGLAMVAHSAKPKEVKTNEKARASLQKEWDSLRAIGAWGEAGAQEWSTVRDASKRAGKRVKGGMVFGIVVEKGSELPEGNPGRKHKGRVALRGNDVRDEPHYLATLQDLGICTGRDELREVLGLSESAAGVDLNGS